MSTDEKLLQSLVRISVAANVGELMNGFEPEGGLRSRFFDERDPAEPGQYRSDIIGAWECARHLAIVRFEKEGVEPTVLGLRAPERAINRAVRGRSRRDLAGEFRSAEQAGRGVARRPDDRGCRARDRRGVR
jgi:hypothetical protein